MAFPDPIVVERLRGMAEAQGVFEPDKYPNTWFDANDLVASMRNAIVIQIVADLPNLDSKKGAQEYRELLVSAMRHEPHRARSQNTLGIVARAAYMISERVPVGTEAETWEKLVAQFVIKPEGT